MASFLPIAAPLTAYNNLGQTGGAVLATNFALPTSNEPTSNLPFDPRHNRINVNKGVGGFTAGVNVQTGLITAPGYSANGVFAQTYSCYFQFNPTEIDVSYGFDTSVTGALNPTFLQGSTATGLVDPQGTMLNQSVSFSLVFDRTFEVWTGPAKAPRLAVPADDPTSGTGPYRYGVMWDIWAIDRLLGIFGEWSGLGPSGPPASNICTVSFASKNIGAQNGFNQLIRGAQGQEIVQGAENPRGYNAPTTDTATNSGFAHAFSGWITSMDVSYLRFDAGMVPTRAAVDLTFLQVFSQGEQSTPNPTPSASTSTGVADGAGSGIGVVLPKTAPATRISSQ